MRSDAEVGLAQGPTRRLSGAEALELEAQDRDLVFDGVDHPVGGLDALATRRAELDVLALKPCLGLLGADLAFGHGHAVLEELGMDALDPHPTLVDQGLVEPGALSPLEHSFGRDPRLGQLAVGQQDTLELGVRAIGLGPLLPSSRRLSLGGLGEVRLEAGRRDLLDDVAPAGAPLDGDLDRQALCPGRRLLERASGESERDRGDHRRPRQSSPVSSTRASKVICPRCRSSPHTMAMRDLLGA